MSQNKQVFLRDWGLVDYHEAWERQEAIFQEIITIKLTNRNAVKAVATKNYLIFTEHPHVYTLGKSGKVEHLLLSEQELEEKHAGFYQTNRGGDITYHGPGQLVGYPILDLDNFFTDIHRYLRYLEEAIILTLAEYGITGERFPGYTGVWIAANQPSARKICAMGVRCSRWVTMHGFALNVTTDPRYFNYIVPCGINDKAVTTMEQELGLKPDPAAVKEKIVKHLSVLFGMEIIDTVTDHGS